MKKSHYNIVHELPDGGAWISNLLSGALIKVTKQDFALFQSANDRQAEPNPTSMQDIFKESGILVPNDFNEFGYIESRLNYHKFRTDILTLTILPTTDCNFNCTYCYENINHKYMNDKTMNALANYVALSLQGKKYFLNAWYGGEPLLAQDTIWRLSKFFKEICAKLGVTYGASIVTNGSLLTEDVVEKLLDYKITSAQITIDGPPIIHNTMRPFSKRYSPDRETFDLIIKNIENACDRIEIAIRMNVCRDNFSCLSDLLETEQLQALKNKIRIYCSPIIPFGIGDKLKNPRILHSCYDFPSFAELEPSFARTFESNCFPSGYDFDGSDCGCCRAICLNNWVVDPEGNLFKCWDSLGDESAILGHISRPPVEEPLIENQKLLKWLSYNPLSRSECKSCKYLPVCMGGCPYRSLEANANSEYVCSTVKYNFKQMVNTVIYKKGMCLDAIESVDGC